MTEPTSSGIISALWRFTLALLAAALVLNFAVAVVRCAWPWIVGVATFVAVVVVVVWWMRGRRGNW